MLIEHLRRPRRGRGGRASSPSATSTASTRRPAASSTPTPSFAERSRPPRRGPAGRATRRRGGSGASSSTSRRTTSTRVYRTLGRDADRDDVVGESSYNPMLDDVVDDLDAAGLLVESDGALCVFPAGFANRDGEPLPLIVRKCDDGLRLRGDRPRRRPRPRRHARVRPAPTTSSARPSPSTSRWSSPWRALAGWLARARARRARRLRQRARRGPQDAQDPQRRDRQARRPARRGRSSARGPGARGARRRPTSADERALARRAIGDRRRSSTPTCRPSAMRDYVFDWDRMLSFDGDTGPVPRLRARADPLDLPSRSASTWPRPAPPSRSPRPRSARSALELLRLPEALGRDARVARAAPAVHLPVRPRPGVHRLLRGTARCSARRRARRATSRLVLCDLTARDPGARALAPRDRRARADVASSLAAQGDPPSKGGSDEESRHRSSIERQGAVAHRGDRDRRAARPTRCGSRWRTRGCASPTSTSRTGDMTAPPEILAMLTATSRCCPIIGGHEGAGDRRGRRRRRHRPRPGRLRGVVVHPRPAGECHYCVSGRSYICDMGATTLVGPMISDGT